MDRMNGATASGPSYPAKVSAKRLVPILGTDCAAVCPDLLKTEKIVEINDGKKGEEAMKKSTGPFGLT
jgi:hypothetical protein